MAPSARDRNLKKLGDLLSRPAFRRSFARGHLRALEEAEVEASAIPRAVLRTLAGLSAKELEALASVKGALKKARVPDRLKAHMV